MTSAGRLSAGTDLVQCVRDTGTDMGATWRPGLTLLWPDGTVVRINVRPMGILGVDDGGEFVFDGQTTPGVTYYLRTRAEPAGVFAEASADGDLWDVNHSYPCERYPGEPSAVRLGKGGPGGQAQKRPTVDRPGTCTIREPRIYGAE